MIRPRKSFVKSKITSGLLDLMIVKPYNSISITDIVDKGNVARSSFYRNFEDKDDVICQFLLRIFYFMEDCRKDTPELTWTDHLFRFAYYDKQWFFKLIFCSGVSDLFRKTLLLYWQDKTPKDTRTYATPFYVNGLYGIMEVWILDGMKETPEELSQIFKTLYLNKENFDY